MRNVTCAIVAAMVLLLASAPPAQAWGGYGGHHGYGGHYGYGGHLTYRYSYPYRSYASSAPDVDKQQPTVYVQQQFYWYYCEDANAYYPYVKECPRGWSKVVPSPSRPAQ
ncbi:MAG: hypothetical protein HY216_03320 [Candidatus Rokubacteria bacterium]|nr:hypothetical protein [Candidatus Rokubacteria bacterium]